MRIAVLGGGNNIHTARWVTSIAARGIDVLLLTQHSPLPIDWGERTEIEVLPHRGMAGYALNAPAIRRALARYKPDLLHAHYAGGYGLSALLSGFRPRLISVWGADVYDVPEVSPFHRWLIRKILRSSDKLTSTSHVMAAQVRKLGIEEPITVVAFGIDTDKFRPAPPRLRDGAIRIGMVKTMAHKYGVDTLLSAFALLHADSELQARGIALSLQLVGGGPQTAELQALARDLAIGTEVEFTGQISHDAIPGYLQGFDIYAAPSRLDSESFGVAIIEASACGLPVVVSDAGGLPEVVDDGVTGYVVPRERPDLLCAKLKCLVLDEDLRTRFGEAGRKRVQRDYEWSICVDQMMAVYSGMLAAA